MLEVKSRVPRGVFLNLIWRTRLLGRRTTRFSVRVPECEMTQMSKIHLTSDQTEGLAVYITLATASQLKPVDGLTVADST